MVSVFLSYAAFRKSHVTLIMNYSKTILIVNSTNANYFVKITGYALKFLLSIPKRIAGTQSAPMWLVPLLIGGSTTKMAAIYNN